jgi:hypothetical protein
MTTTITVRTTLDVINLGRDNRDRDFTPLYHAVATCESLVRQIQEEAAGITARLERVVTKVAIGGRLNTLGELQAAGPYFDTLCARYAMAQDHADEIAKMFGVEIGR